MTGGRYLWWLMVSVAGFLFAAVVLEYLMWLTVRMAGCREMASACALTTENVAELVQSIAMYGACVIILMATAIRLRWLKMSMMWWLAAAVWLAASLPFVSATDQLWKTRMLMDGAISPPPLSLAFLAALFAMLSGPRERSASISTGIRMATGLAAIYGVLITIMNPEWMAHWPASLSISAIPADVITGLSSQVEAMEPLTTISCIVALAVFMMGAMAHFTPEKAAPRTVPRRRVHDVTQSRRPVSPT